MQSDFSLCRMAKSRGIDLKMIILYTISVYLWVELENKQPNKIKSNETNWTK